VLGSTLTSFGKSLFVGTQELVAEVGAMLLPGSSWTAQPSCGSEDAVVVPGALPCSTAGYAPVGMHAPQARAITDARGLIIQLTRYFCKRPFCVAGCMIARSSCHS
jgi:hypothetical protein